MPDPIEISSDERLADVDHHFRVTAGPGAGKTHWLIGHIEQTIRRSTRLTACSKIAVISYTNVAVREIVTRLGDAADSVDVSTIHSFLYRHVVRPYLHLLKNASGGSLVAHALVDSHDVHFPAHDKVDAWARAAGQGRVMGDFPKGSKDRLFEQLRSLTVRIDSSGKACFSPRVTEKLGRALTALLTSESLLQYKQQYWAEGTLDHGDILYFAHRLLSEHPTLLEFLRDRFPYLFIDEFQDTLPVQAALVRSLAAAGTTIGVIGDPEQAIFGFVDASPDHFRSFELDGHKNYTILGNRRSTKAIIGFLNRVRTDGLQQDPIRTEQGSLPVAYSGSLTDALLHARNSVPPGTPFLVLAWKHKTLLQARLQSGGLRKDPWDELDAADEARARLLNCLATALDLAQRRLFELAVHKVVQGISSARGFRKPIDYAGEVDITKRRSAALSILELLFAKHSELLNLSTLDFYNFVRETVPKCLDGATLPAVRAGKGFHVAASAQRYHDLFHSLQTPDETRSMRTIHQAKGAEEAAVFVLLNDDHVEHVVSPTANHEPQRVIYVALSRAKDYLFVHCPTDSRLAEFASLGLATHSLANTPVASASRQKGRRSPS